MAKDGKRFYRRRLSVGPVVNGPSSPQASMDISRIVRLEVPHGWRDRPTSAPMPHRGAVGAIPLPRRGLHCHALPFLRRCPLCALPGGGH